MDLREILAKNNILLAPLAGVTDVTFRTLCKEQGCGLTCTEMVSAKGLAHGNANTRALLLTSPTERPCAVQLFGSDPAIMAKEAAALAEDPAIGVIDINMGCPMHKITGNGEGSALMKDPPRAAQIVRAIANATDKPVTVKFRKGWDEHSINAVEFALRMQDAGAAAVTVHGRTRQQMYSGNADWDIIAAVKKAVGIPVIGNGDVKRAQDALDMLAHTGCDGVMVARGAMGNPWIFGQIAALQRGEAPVFPTAEERIHTALRHARALVQRRGAHGVAEIRKHVAWYVQGMRGAARVRGAVNGAKTLEELEAILLRFVEGLHGDSTAI